MKLIFIYGPPAVGKLAVARELSKVTGYKIFHNHLTVDLASSIFPMGTKAYSDLVEDIRLEVVKTAAKNKVVGIIFTFVYGIETYGGRGDDKFIKKVIDKVGKYKGQVLFVKLICEEKELHKRLKRLSRRNFKKVHKIKTLKSIKKKYDLSATVPFGRSLSIDNTRLSPQKVANMIKDHYKLV